MTIPLEWSEQGPPDLPGEVWRTAIPSTLAAKAEVMERLQREMLCRRMVADGDLSWLCLCLDEALVNAVLHGNEADDTVPVDIALGQAADGWWLRIDDRGCGFIPERDLPDTDDEANLLLEHGRGVRLMREWLDRLAYYRRGATLVMGRRISPPEEQG